MFFDLRFASRWRNNGDPILLVSTDKNQKNQGTKSENFLPRKSYLDMEGKFRIIEVFISNAKKYIGIPSSSIDYMYKLFRMFFFRCVNKLVSYEIHPYTGLEVVARRFLCRPWHGLPRSGLGA